MVLPTCPGPRAPAPAASARTNASTNAQHIQAEPAPDSVLDLGLYLDGILPEALARTVEVHLVECEACRLRVKEIRDLKAVLEDRALWRARGRDDSGLGVGTSCLSAAEILLALEGKASPRAEQHLALCARCTDDVLSIEESTQEHAAGKLERPAPELVEVLRSVGRPGSGIEMAVDVSDAADPLAPIIVLAAMPGAQESRTPSKRISKRIAPRHPSKRLSSSTSRATRARPVTVAGGLFTFAAAAAAAAIVALLVTQSGPAPTDSGTSSEVARNAPPRNTTSTSTRTPGVGTPNPDPTKKPLPQPLPGKGDTHENAGGLEGEPTDPPEPQSPFEVPAPSPETPGPGETPGATPSTQSNPGPNGTSPQGTPAVSQKPALAGDLAKGPLPLDAPVADDGGRIELDLTHLSGGIAVKNGAGSDTEKWSRIAKRDGRLALKPGDRIRSTGGAFLSLDGGTYELSLAAKSEVVVRGLAHGPVIGLTEGRVLCEVEKLPSEKHLIIATNSADFECTGTVFSVSADSQKALCAVEEGTVVCRAPLGEPRALAAGFALTVARGEAPGEPRPAGSDVDSWARSVRPEREIVYMADFDRGDQAGFTGSLTDQGAFRGVGKSLIFEPAEATNKFWGLAARAPKGKVKNFKPTLDMRIQFSIWLEKESHVLLQVMNERQTKYFKRDFGVQPGNRWVTLTVPVMDLETYYDPGKSPMREQDLVSELEIFTGDPGDKFKALLDDVIVYRKHYR